MSSRPLLKPHLVVTNGSMSANITSDPTIIQMLSMISYHVTWAGTSPVGEITVEVSNDYSLNPDGTTRNTGTWNTLPLSSDCLINTNTDEGFIDIDANAGYALRLVYTRTSGTGTMQVTVNGKVA